MKYPSRHALFVRTLVVGILIAFLSGCALAPGMYFDSSYNEAEPAKGEPAVTPVVKAITPQLVAQERQLAENEIQADLSGVMLPSQSYKIGAGDHLAITVWDHPELVMPMVSMAAATLPGMPSAAAASLPSGYVVSAEGKIQFPYAGDLKVDGLTELQARDLLVQHLVKYIKQPEVTLRVLNYRSKRIYVDGEVKQPGIVQVDDIPLSLPEALNRAGGFTALGDQSRISIARAGTTYWINLPKLIKKGGDPSLIMLSSGDMLSVRPREETKVYVTGEVVKPAALTLINGHLSLNQALGESGGINPQSGDGHLIYVIRNANDTQPVVYHLDAHSPVMLALADNFELKANDVIYVDSAPMVRLNRIISLILPTAQTITIANRGFQ